MTDWLLSTIEHSLTVIPLEVFAFVASFIEEIIPPIPAVPIMLSLGGAAKLQGHDLFFILLLAIVSAFGKTIGSIIVYHIVDTLEDVVVSRFGSFFNVRPGELEAFGAKFGRGARDYVVLTLIRAFPLIPSSIVSIGSGLLRIPLRLFITATLIGTIIRDGVYLYVGFIGAEAVLTYYLHGGGNVTKAAEITIALTLLAVLVYRYHTVKAARAASHRDPQDS